MHIAFITPEFALPGSTYGGLGNYLRRMSLQLTRLGHSIEIFTPASDSSECQLFEGAMLNKVFIGHPSRPCIMKNIFVRKADQATVVHLDNQARYLSDAFERRHAVKPFDFVQSADFQAVGLHTRSTAACPHLVRCSSAADLYNLADDLKSPEQIVRQRFEQSAILRAKFAYAPSMLVSNHLTQKLNRPVGVLRPPALLETEPQPPLHGTVPNKYLIHFGQLVPRKGTFLFIEALKRAFLIEPGIRVVIVGTTYDNKLEQALASLDRYRVNVTALYSLPKPFLLGLVANAHASVLPSMVDNLPNTVIESLLLGVPVIGTNGASIDELVDDGTNGLLVELGNREQLASAIVKQWRNETIVKRGFTWPDSNHREFYPDEAAHNLTKLAQSLQSN